MANQNEGMNPKPNIGMKDANQKLKTDEKNTNTSMKTGGETLKGIKEMAKSLEQMQFLMASDMDEPSVLKTLKPTQFIQGKRGSQSNYFGAIGASNSTALRDAREEAAKETKKDKKEKSKKEKIAEIQATSDRIQALKNNRKLFDESKKAEKERKEDRQHIEDVKKEYDDAIQARISKNDSDKKEKEIEDRKQMGFMSRMVNDLIAKPLQKQKEDFINEN